MSLIGDRLRELRGSSTLREMAEPIGIKYNAWARYECGGSVPGGDIIAKICRVHAVSADWLLGIDRKSSATAIASGKNSIAVAGSNNNIVPGEDWRCAKCPYKRKLKALEKLISK